MATLSYDPAALADDLQTRVIEPRQRLSLRLRQAAKITRLVSSLSPAEMTVDPTFALNPDLPDVSNLRQATESFDCDGADEDPYDAHRTLTLSDGRSVLLPSYRWLDDHRMTTIAWLQQEGLTEPANKRIEQTGPTGLPVVLQDNTSLLETQVSTPILEDTAKGCGCSTSDPRVGLLAVGLLGLGLRRRRATTSA